MANNRDSGIVYLASLTNTAAAGLKPEYSLTKISRSWYEERMIGFRRQYAAKGVNEQVDMLIRINYLQKARIGLYAILGNEEQQQVRGTIDLYTLQEFDPAVDLIQEALNTSEGVGWVLSSVQYEDETNLIHYEWTFAVI